MYHSLQVNNAYWRNSVQLEPPSQVPGIIPDIQPYQAQVEMGLRNAMQQRLVTKQFQEPLRIYLFNQMSANNYNNADWFSMVKAACDTVLFCTASTRRPIIEVINGMVEMVLEHYMARAISRDQDLQRMLDQSQVNTVNKVLAEMQEHANALENFLRQYMAQYQQQARSVPVQNPWPTAGLQLMDQNQQYAQPQQQQQFVQQQPVMQQPVQMSNGFQFSPVQGQVQAMQPQQAVYQQPQPQPQIQGFQWPNNQVAQPPQQPQAMQFYTPQQPQQQVVYQQPQIQQAPQQQMNNQNSIPLYVPPAPQQQSNVPFQFAPIEGRVAPQHAAPAQTQNFSMYNESGAVDLQERVRLIIEEEKAKGIYQEPQHAPQANGRNPVEGQERPPFNYATTGYYDPSKPVTANPYQPTEMKPSKSMPGSEDSDAEFWDTLEEIDANPDGSSTMKFSSGKVITTPPTRMAVEPTPGVAQPYRTDGGMRPVGAVMPEPQIIVSDEQPVFVDDSIHPPLFCKATHWLDTKYNCIRRRNRRMNYEEHELDDSRVEQADNGKVIPTYVYEEAKAGSEEPEFEPSGSVDFTTPVLIEDIMISSSTATAMSFLKFAHNTYDNGTPLEFSNLNAEAITLVDKKAFKADCPNLFSDNLPRNIDQIYVQLGKCATHSGMLFKILDQRATAATNKILNVGMGVPENITSFFEDYPELVKYIKRVYKDEGIKAFNGGLHEIVYAVCCLASGDLESFLLKQGMDSLVPLQVSGMSEKDKTFNFETPQVVGLRRKNLLGVEQRAELLANTVVVMNPEYVVLIPATMEDLCLSTEQNKVLTISESLCGPLYKYLFDIQVRINSRELNYTNMVVYTYEGERFELMPALLGDPMLFCARHAG